MNKYKSKMIMKKLKLLIKVQNSIKKVIRMININKPRNKFLITYNLFKIIKIFNLTISKLF